jgi:hypothetical protein
MAHGRYTPGGLPAARPGRRQPLGPPTAGYHWNQALGQIRPMPSWTNCSTIGGGGAVLTAGVWHMVDIPQGDSQPPGQVGGRGAVHPGITCGGYVLLAGDVYQLQGACLTCRGAVHPGLTCGGYVLLAGDVYQLQGDCLTCRGALHPGITCGGYVLLAGDVYQLQGDCTTCKGAVHPGLT